MDQFRFTEGDGGHRHLPGVALEGLPHGSVSSPERGRSRARGLLGLQPNRWRGTYTGVKRRGLEFLHGWLIETRGGTHGNVAADI
jgi:hypothetical protein